MNTISFRTAHGNVSRRVVFELKIYWQDNFMVIHRYVVVMSERFPQAIVDQSMMFVRFLIVLSLYCYTVHGMEAKWTPNDDDSSGPLPLSMKQRQQLMQLDQAIQSSPDPAATLENVAASNDMSVSDLASMLERNRMDLEQGLGSRKTLLGSLVSGVVGTTTTFVRKHPRIVLVAATSIASGLYLKHTLPRTGLVVSTLPFSKGPTTWMSPPPTSTMVQELLFTDKSKGEQQPWLPVSTKIGWGKGTKRDAFKRYAVAEMSVDLEDLCEVDHDDDMRIVEETCARLVDYCPAWTEFTNLPMSFITDEDGNVIFISKEVGDFGRYGLQSMFILDRLERKRRQSVVLATKEDSHFEGQMHTTLEIVDTKVMISVWLLFQKQKIGKQLSLKIVNELASSIATSLNTRIRQSLARRTQSSKYQGNASKRAKDKRELRYFKEKALEEMAGDRRRRWQRNNPNSGSYRPSGDRMRSPNNAMY